MNYSIISKNRNLLMGIATLMIVIFHTNFLNIGGYDLIRQKMDIGVDVFLSLSGFGLFYSLGKNDNKINFWKKRFGRIYPPLIIVIIVFTFIKRIFNYSVYGKASSLMLMTGLNFFVSDGNLLYWFVSAIIIIYLLAPFYFSIFNKNPQLVTLIALLLSAVFIFLDFYYHKGKYLIFFARVPSFIIGVYLGFLSDIQCKIKNRAIYIQLFILCMLPLGLWDYFRAINRAEFFYKYIIFIFMAPCFIISCCYILDYFLGKANLLYKGISYLGSISFEVYLIHEMLRNIVTPILKKTMNYDNTYIIYAIILFLVTVVCADWIRKMCKVIINFKKVIYRYNE